MKIPLNVIAEVQINWILGLNKQRIILQEMTKSILKICSPLLKETRQVYFHSIAVCMFGDENLLPFH